MGTRYIPSEPSYPHAIRPNVFQDGLEFQDFVCQELAKYNIILQNLTSKKYQFEIGENLQGFEIKFDSRCTETNRLSIEIAEKSRRDMPDWTKSGILRNDTSWLYIQGNYQKLFVFAKRFLLNYYREKKPQCEEKHGTIQTFYLPFEVACRHAALVITI